VYVERMTQANVHMTAYIANFLIKGYANVGDLDKAREIFESLADPPCGVAAPNNHAPHHAGEAPEVNIMELVYREVWGPYYSFAIYSLRSFSLFLSLRLGK
jgi:pentatricopeptide repeat protein